MKNLCLCMLFTQEYEPEGAKKGSKQLYLHKHHHWICKCCNGQSHTPLALPVRKNKKESPLYVSTYKPRSYGLKGVSFSLK